MILGGKLGLPPRPDLGFVALKELTKGLLRRSLEELDDPAGVYEMGLWKGRAVLEEVPAHAETTPAFKPEDVLELSIGQRVFGLEIIGGRGLFVEARRRGLRPFTDLAGARGRRGQKERRQQ